MCATFPILRHRERVFRTDVDLSRPLPEFSGQSSAKRPLRVDPVTTGEDPRAKIMEPAKRGCGTVVDTAVALSSTPRAPTARKGNAVSHECPLAPSESETGRASRSALPGERTMASLSEPRIWPPDCCHGRARRRAHLRHHRPGSPAERDPAGGAEPAVVVWQMGPAHRHRRRRGERAGPSVRLAARPGHRRRIPWVETGDLFLYLGSAAPAGILRAGTGLRAAHANLGALLCPP